MLLDSEEVLNFLGKEEKHRLLPLEESVKERNRVYSCLDSMGKTLEEIMNLTGLSLDVVRKDLLELLLEDQIRECAPGYYSIEL